MGSTNLDYSHYKERKDKFENVTVILLVVSFSTYSAVYV